jgi:hypothetical protein
MSFIEMVINQLQHKNAQLENSAAGCKELILQPNEITSPGKAIDAIHELALETGLNDNFIKIALNQLGNPTSKSSTKNLEVLTSELEILHPDSDIANRLLAIKKTACIEIMQSIAQNKLYINQVTTHTEECNALPTERQQDDCAFPIISTLFGEIYNTIDVT